MGDGIYLNNCHDGLHGPIDTWSWDWWDVSSWATWDPTKRHRWIDDVVLVVVFQMFIFFVLLWIERHGLRLVGLLSSFGTCWTNRPRTPCSHLEHYAEYDMYIYIYIYIYLFLINKYIYRERYMNHINPWSNAISRASWDVFVFLIAPISSKTVITLATWSVGASTMVSNLSAFANITLAWCST